VKYLLKSKQVNIRCPNVQHIFSFVSIKFVLVIVDKAVKPTIIKIRLV